MDAETLKEIRKEIPELLELEKVGRELASARDEKVSRVDVDWLDDVVRALRIAKVKGEMGRLNKESEFVSALVDCALRMSSKVLNCILDGIKRKDCKVIPPMETSPEERDRTIERMAAISDLSAVEQTSREVFGRKCTWLFREVKHDDYTESMLLNDLSSCVHSLASYWELKYGKLHIEGRCAWEE
jgi:hypothetical protein